MVPKIIFLIIFFYFLTLLQVSFFIYFPLFRIIPNFIIISVILINIFEKPNGKLGIISAFLGGIYLDIFSIDNYNLFFGFYTLISVIISLFIKFFLRKHVQIPVPKRF